MGLLYGVVRSMSLLGDSLGVFQSIGPTFDEKDFRAGVGQGGVVTLGSNYIS
jgi:hypothetical protein